MKLLRICKFLTFTFILLGLLQFPGRLSAQKLSQGKLYLTGGIGLAKLVSDSLDLKPTLLPVISADYLQPLLADFSLLAGLHYTLAGSKTQNSDYRFLNHYVGFSAGPNYRFGDFLTLYATYQYNQLLLQRVGVLDGSRKSGIDWSSGTAYHSQSGCLAGAGIRLQKNLWFHYRYQFGFSPKEFSGGQFVLSFSLSDLKFEPRAKKFRSLPEALASELECRKLVLMRQYMKELPADIGKLRNLEYLVLDGNELHSLPKEIGNLENLRNLSLRNNHLDSLPIEIGDLVNLEELYLAYNQLYELPQEIGRLKALKFLYIGKNNLTSLPSSIGELTNLIELDLSNSGPMLRIPPELSKLKSLELLIIDRSAQFPIPFNPPNMRFRILIKN